MTEESFGSVLRRLRLAAALTQEQLAERAELSVQAISALERGARRSPYRETVQRLADGLGLNSEDREVFATVSRTGRVRTADNGSAAACQLPLSAFHFTGRIQEVDAVTELLSARGPRQAPCIITIQGMAGVGKTAFAVRAARLAEAHFPDGQFYVQLNGFGAGQPLTPADALGQLLRATGIQPDAVPASVERAAALLRSELASKRVLIVLDNASGAAQVMPLLPGGSTCAVLVTSRQNLTTLPAERRFQLAPLDHLEAVDVIRALIGSQRTAAEPEAIAELTELCGNLPLALSIAAARLAARPTWTARHLVDRLRNETGRLNELAENHIGVRAALAVSISQLPNRASGSAPSLVDAFSLLGILTGPDIGIEVAARLLDTTDLAAETALEQLVDVHLLESPTFGRYRLHDLVHVYARETAKQDLTHEARGSALERVIALYRAVAWRAAEMFEPASARLHWCPAEWLQSESVPPLASAQDSFDWLHTERDNVVAILYRRGTDPEVSGDLIAGLVLGLANYIAVHGRIGDWSQGIASTLSITRDPRLRAALLHDLGIAMADGGEPERAADGLRQSADAFRAIGDARGEALACNNRSKVLDRLGRPEQAIPIAQRSRDLYRQLGDRRGESRALINLSLLYCSVNAHSQELTSVTESLVISEAIDSPLGIAVGQHDLGCALLHFDMFDLATDYLRRSLQAYEKVGHNAGLTDARRDLGEALVDQGSVADGFEQLQVALAIAVERGDDRREASVHHSFGKAYLAVGDNVAAQQELVMALDYYQGRAPKVAEEIVQLLGDLEG